MQPVYCLSRSDHARLRLLAAIDHNARLNDLTPSEPDIDRHWLGITEVADRFVSFPEAITTVGEITAGCGVVLPDGRPIWPALKLPDHQSPDECLADLAREGLAKLYGERATRQTRQRMQSGLTSRE